jgi:hypothetical protein
MRRRVSQPGEKCRVVGKTGVSEIMAEIIPIRDRAWPFPLDRETKHLDRMHEIHVEDGADHRCEPGWCPYYRDSTSE